MSFVDWIVAAVIVCVLGLAGFYILKAKKAGEKCIGCPDNGSCSGNCGCSCRNREEK